MVAFFGCLKDVYHARRSLSNIVRAVATYDLAQLVKLLARSVRVRPEGHLDPIEDSFSA